MESDYPEIIDKKNRCKSSPSVPINKTIYILWLQGFINAPRIVRMCMNSWIRYNPDWTVVKLDKSNLADYVDLSNYRQDVLTNITNSAFSDIIRIELLSKFGGLWVDATLLCMRPLNSWLPHFVKGGFFLFEKPADDRLVSSWFIYSDFKNYITQSWLEKTKNYWKLQNVDAEGFWKSYEIGAENYFWFHRLFERLHNNNLEFREKWNRVPKSSAVNCHYLQNHGLLNAIDDTIKEFIDNNHGTVQKLTYRTDPGEIKSSSLLQYIFYKNALKFIHIPKTGGTSIENASMDKGIYWGKNDTSLKTNTRVSPWHCPQKDKRFFFCVIRCPYERIISEFYHQNEVENYNRMNLNDWIKKSLQLFFENENHSNNHFIQQTRFAKCCNILISFENLNKNLSIMLNKFELPNLVLDNYPGGVLQQEKRKNVSFDRLSVNDIDKDNIDLINKIYSEDIELWSEIKEVGIKWGCNM